MGTLSRPEGDDPLPSFAYPEWQRAYRVALVQTNIGKLEQNILDAETVILRRRAQLARVWPRASAAAIELDAINDALQGLRVLRSELQVKPRVR